MIYIIEHSQLMYNIRKLELNTMNIIILGPPGSGKGTQAEILSKQLAIPHISMGNILRKEVEANSELGQKVAKIMKDGNLVDDDTIMAITVKVLRDPECSNGFILDGVPRSLVQAEAIKDNDIRINHVIELACSDEDIITRITNRRVHPASGRVYNILSSPPKVANTDDVTGEDLIQREDDREETVRNRLDSYKQITSPLHDYYATIAKNDDVSYHKVDSNSTPSELAEHIEQLLNVQN